MKNLFILLIATVALIAFIIMTQPALPVIGGFCLVLVGCSLSCLSMGRGARMLILPPQQDLHSYEDMAERVAKDCAFGLPLLTLTSLAFLTSMSSLIPLTVLFIAALVGTVMLVIDTVDVKVAKGGHYIH